MMQMVGGVPATGKQFSVNPGVDKLVWFFKSGKDEAGKEEGWA